MANTIITKNSSTASAVPAAGSLTQGELAVNVTDKKLYTKNSGGSVVEITPTNSVNITGTTTASIPTSALASGTADSSKVLLGNRTWGTLSGGVSSLNGLTGSVTTTDHNGIGSITPAFYYGAGGGFFLNAGSTYAAGYLYGKQDYVDNGFGYDPWGTIPYGAAFLAGGMSSSQASNFVSLGLSGTWRCLVKSTCQNSPYGTYYYPTFFVRVS